MTVGLAPGKRTVPARQGHTFRQWAWRQAHITARDAGMLRGSGGATRRTAGAPTSRTVETVQRRGPLVPHVSNDALLAVVLAALVMGASLAQGLSPRGALFGALLCAPLAWRRRSPLVALAVLAFLMPAYVLVDDPPPLYVVPAMVALYTAAAWGSRRGTLVLAAALVPYVALIVLVSSPDAGTVLGQMLERFSQFALALAVGEAVRSQRALLAAVRDRAERAARERELEARRQLDEERVRIAQDVHDIVAHSIAAISTQASVGVHVAREEPAKAIEVLDSIKAESAQALHDLRYALNGLRDPSGVAPTDPTPSVHDVPTLVQRARDSGLPVTLRMEGSPDLLPAPLQVAIYRIVQEALTNVMRHARGARATVRIAVRAPEVEVDIHDDGRGVPTAASGSGSGSGLVGMRERASVMGGALEAGRRADGGFGVRALLPIDREAS